MRKDLLWIAVFTGIRILSYQSAIAASGPVLLSINDADPAAVIITATGLNPSVNDSSNTANNGVDLLGFFAASEFGMTLGQDLTGTLVGGNTGVSYNDAYRDNYSTGGGSSYTDLELYVDINSPGENRTESFSTSQPAFTGSWTIDLSNLGIDAAALPAAGTQGEILSGFSGDPGNVIGAWEVTSPVPEPTATSLLALGWVVIGTLIYRRRTKSPNPVSAGKQLS